MGIASVLRRADKAVQDTKQSISFAAIAAVAALAVALVTLVIVVATK